MKSKKIITMVTLILIIVILSIASFVGIYWQKGYKVVNVVPDYVLGMEFKDSRVINLEADKTATKTIYDSEGNIVLDIDDSIEYTEENGYTTVEYEANSEDVLNTENYKKAESILKERIDLISKNEDMKKYCLDQYIIDLNNETGDITIRIPENEYTNEVIGVLLETGTFELIDTQTNEVLLDTSLVNDSIVVSNTSETGITSIYLQVELNKEGREKLEEISNTYKKTETEDTEENAEEETKYVTVNLNGEAVMTTYFGATLSNGILNIYMGSGTDINTLKEYFLKGSKYSIELNSGMLPIVYSQTSQISKSNITNEQLNMGLYIAIGITALMIVFFIIRFKLKGLFAGVLQIGYIALLLLAVRYTNVKITLEGIVGIALSAIINCVYLYMIFKNIDLDFIKDLFIYYSINFKILDKKIHLENDKAEFFLYGILRIHPNEEILVQLEYKISFF